MLSAIAILIIIMIVLWRISIPKAIGAFIVFVGICSLTSSLIIGIFLSIVGIIMVFSG